jgi:PIN domain nuclease of toxin-antitoxin system
MKYLLDTHTWLWLLSEPERVGKQTTGIVLDPGNELYLSLASAWEISIKHAQGRLTLPDSPQRYIESRTSEDGVNLLPMRLEHLCAAASLPKHHMDPFDRVLISQAQVEQMILVSHDSWFKHYDVNLQDAAL